MYLPMRKKDKLTYELLMYNRNHMEQAPHQIIETVSLELASHLMDSLSWMFEDNGYKSFKMMIRCPQSGAIIRDEKSA